MFLINIMLKCNFLSQSDIYSTMNILKKLHFISDNIQILIALTVFLLIILYSKNISEAIKESFELCLGVIIPALFPTLLLCTFIGKIGFSINIKRIFHTPINTLWGLSGNSAECILLALTGGYISASATALTRYKNKEISLNEAKRLVLFFTSPGFSFCVNIAGISCYSNKNIGYIFFISSVITNLLSALFFNLFSKNSEPFIQNEAKPSFSDSLIISVKNISEQIIGICSWILVFTTIKAIIFSLDLPEIFKCIFSVSGEITASVFFCADNFSPVITSLILFLGGICIFLQLYPAIRELKINPMLFISVRLLQALCCMLITHIIMILFPVTLNTSNIKPIFSATSNTYFGSLCLLLLCAVFLSSLKETHNKLQNHSKNDNFLQ